MTCCAAAIPPGPDARAVRSEELRLATSTTAAGLNTLRLAVPGMHCGGCVASLERALGSVHGLEQARANLTTRSVSVSWRDPALSPDTIMATIRECGFEAFALDDEQAETADARTNRDLLTRMAVAGFASANVMLLSVSVWSGADGATRDLMHWISAFIALPAAVYAGRPFFASALRGLRAGRLNMDAPISLAVILAALVSLSEVIRGGEDAYFDAVVMLLFLLLIGRWLDAVMRGKARGAARALARLLPRGAWVRGEGGAVQYRPVDTLRPGDTVVVAAGERLPVDGVVVAGHGSVDTALVTGESLPVSVAPGLALDAGVMSLEGSLSVRATAVGEETTLAVIARLCAAAEDRKSGLARLADRAAAIYAPLVHGLALVTLLGWMTGGASFREAMMAAIAVLIVTCPCALGLAAPMAQAVASGTLFRHGVMLKDGAALERLARIRHAVFDKTGVLTTGTPALVGGDDIDPETFGRAMALAAQSSHPLSLAILHAGQARGLTPAPCAPVREHTGEGVSAGGMRLGSAAFCGAPASADDRAECWFTDGADAPVRFAFAETLRPDAAATLAQLRASDIDVGILSGDRAAPVGAIAERLGITRWQAALRPAGKIAAIEALEAGGDTVLMVGDGINDAPALAAASVSMAPASASDIGRASADLVFTGASLSAVALSHDVARRTRRVILQNFGLAAAYNTIAVPLAMLGHAGPLVAAAAMASSSLLVTANALRLAKGTRS